MGTAPSGQSEKPAAEPVPPQESPQETIERLETDVNTLSARCARLEAQNILVSVQQLDLLARGMALVLSALSVCFYWKLLWGVIPILPNLIKTWSPQLQQVAWISWALHPLALRVTVYALMFVPYFHHKATHGLAHRRFEVFAVAFIVISRIKLCRWRERMFMTSETTRVPEFGVDMNEDAIWEANYEISARFLYVSILRLRGLWTKSAQYLSSRADFVPVSYVRELKKLQDEAPATDWQHVKQTLARVPGLLREVTDIVETPIASASIGQVHTARLASTGERVVLKVQHPFARTLLTDDFWSLKVISRIITWLEPEYEFFEILMREWAVEAKKELNFFSEAENLKSAQASIDLLIRNETCCVQTNASSSCSKTFPFQVEIPRPLKHLSNASVLVMSYCEGVRVDNMQQIEEWNIPREAVMDAVAQTFAHMMYVTDIFNGDPHCGNIFIRPGTQVSKSEGFTLVLLDWGLTKRLPEQKRLAFCQMVYAASTFDFGLLLDAFKTIGLKLKRENVAEDLEGVRFVLRDLAPREKTQKRIKAKIKTDRERMDSKKRGQKIPMESKAYPGEFFFFIRVNEMLHGLGSRLKVEMTYLDVLKPYAERGLLLSPLYSDKDEHLKRAIPVFEVSDKSLNESIGDVVTALEHEGMIAGAQVSVLDRNGHILASVASGHMGGLKKAIPMRPDALVLGYSCTKAITATVAHLMVEQDYLSYDEPVAERVWKAFCPTDSVPDELRKCSKSVKNLEERWEWKRMITLRHILTHSAGLWAALPAQMTIKSMASCETCCEAFEYNRHAPQGTVLPTRRPGEKCEYHFMSFGWLVAGTLCGAYCLKHAKKSVTFEEVYSAMLLSKLAADATTLGFRPCGGDGGFPIAQTDTSVDALSRMVQMRREAEAMGEEAPRHISGIDSSVLEEVQESFRGKEFLLDQRIWNCEDARSANVPAAGGRFTAMGLAKFYNELGTGRLVGNDTLSMATGLVTHENTANALQGQTAMTSSDSEKEGVSLGMGYQLIRFNGDKEVPTAFGHAGVGGSIGFFHKTSGISVAIMLNKADGDKDTAKRIIHTISKHYKW